MQKRGAIAILWQPCRCFSLSTRGLHRSPKGVPLTAGTPGVQTNQPNSTDQARTNPQNQIAYRPFAPANATDHPINWIHEKVDRLHIFYILSDSTNLHILCYDALE
jgi:hypothetical protein